MNKFYIFDLSGCNPEEFGDEAELAKSHDGQPCQVLNTTCEVDGNFEHDYHDIEFADGVVMSAVSGCSLTETKDKQMIARFDE